MPDNRPVLPTLTGPTAVGKTKLSIDLANHFHAEIISVDSRQVYQKLDIGTAKPASDVLEQVPHHLISERTLDEPLSAGDFARLANQRIREILDRGNMPLLVGGSGLYLHALQEGLADIPDVPDEVREKLQQRLDTEGADVLWEELKQVDPASIERVDPTKTERMLRALEVYNATGRPLSYYYEHQPDPPYRYQTVVLNRERSNLYDRINRRVDRMLQNGLRDEVQELLEVGYDLSYRVLRTIGYREVIRHEQDEIDKEEMVRLIKRNSRRYAKRQLTWFRRYDHYSWLKAPFSVKELISHFDRVEV